MVDISDKPLTSRTAIAAGEVHMSPATLQRIREGTAAKGDVLAVAQVAGIQAAKHCWEMIPLCHPLPLSAAQLEFSLEENPPRVDITARVCCTWGTGVEMEALAAVSVAALTIYDMCKAMERGMSIEHIRLLSKTGGRSGTYQGG